MNLHVTIGNRLCLLPEVKGMESWTDRRMGPAIRVEFRNGFVLSIVANPNFARGGRYASGEYFEIAVFDPEDDFFKVFPYFSTYDDVLGYQSISQILEIGNAIAQYK